MLKRLNYTFDSEKIMTEIAGRSFVPHDFIEWEKNGNSALLLVTTKGEQNHLFDEPMLPTDDLNDMPYTASIWDDLGISKTRSRFMKVAAGGVNMPHLDTGKWWQDKHRIHIPIKTNTKAIFHCGNEEVHMQAGTCWLVNTKNYRHSARNNGAEDRIHLVIDVYDNEIARLS